jgi:predicted anti-sigma-YlaC factor YlaD
MPAGFLEEADGSKSATRLVAVLCGGSMMVIGLAVAFVLVWVALHPSDREGLAGMFGALSAILGALAGGAWGALRERNTDAVIEP